MTIQFDVAHTEEHFEQILELQQQNLRRAISIEQQSREGFVFAEHTVSLLRNMASRLPQVIALDGGKIIGYNLAMLAEMKEDVPSLRPMFEEFEKSQYQGKPLKGYKFIVGGQVCVAKGFRGQGLLKRLYHKTHRMLPQNYQLCVTEIADSNRPSLAAHQKMGFETIRSYHDGETQWHIVAWKLPNSQAPCKSESYPPKT